MCVPFNNWTDGNLDVVREMITHPYTVLGVGDAGAHCGLLSDGSFPTFLLSHWGKDRPTGLRDGEHAGQLPGKLIRGAQAAPTVAA